MKNKPILKDIAEATSAVSLTENFINSLIALALSPKVKKIEKQLKNDPEYQALEKKAKQIQDELDVINKRLEKVVTEREKIVSDMRKNGMKVSGDMSASELRASYEKWFSDLTSEVKKLKKGEKVEDAIKRLK